MPILLEGISLENIVEHNHLPWGTKDITVQSLTGLHRPIDTQFSWNNSVTQLAAYLPCAYNIVRHNTAATIRVHTYDHGHDTPVLHQRSWNNAVYGNTITNWTNQSGGYRISNSHVYIPQNELSFIRACNGWYPNCDHTSASSILANDPTDDSWLSSMTGSR